MRERYLKGLFLSGFILVNIVGADSAIPGQETRDDVTGPNIMVNRFGAPPPKKPNAPKPTHKLKLQHNNKSNFNNIVIRDDYFTAKNLKYDETHNEIQKIINDPNIGLSQLNAFINAHKKYIDEHMFDIEPSLIDKLMGYERKYDALNAAEKVKANASKNMLVDHSLLLLKEIDKMEKENLPITIDTYEELLENMEKTLKYISFINDDNDLGMSIFIQRRIDEYKEKYNEALLDLDKSYKIFNYKVPDWITNSFSKLSSWLDF